MATATAKGFVLICPHCGSNDAITLNLNDPFQTLTCDACSEEGTPREFAAKAAENAARWSATVAWLDSAPAE